MKTSSDRSQRLGTEPVGKLLLEFTIPAVFGMMIQALYNIVDRIFLGQVGQLAIGGVYITFPIMIMIMAFNMLVGIGGNSLSSIRLGQNRKEEAQKILNNALFMLVSSAIILGLLFYFNLDTLLRLFGASDALMPYAKDYILIILLGIIFQSVSFGLNNFIRGEGSPRMAMFTMLIGALTNIVLDYIFILVFHWGVKGAALATIIGQFLSMVWVLRYFLKGDSLLSFELEKMKPNLPLMKEIVSLGVAPFSMQLVNSLVVMILNRSLQQYGGDLATASMGVIQSISTFAFMPIFGMNQGSQPIFGFNYGAENYKRLRRALFLAVRNATIYMCLAFVIIYTFPEQLIGVFIPDPKDFELILPIAKPGLLLWHLALPILGFQIISSNYFQATGKPKIGTFLGLLRQLIVLIPMILIIPRFFGLVGIWYAVIVSDLVAFVTTVFFMRNDLKKIPKVDYGLE